MYFEARPLTSVDIERDVEIFRPRVVVSDDSDDASFEFRARKGSRRHGFSCDGRIQIHRDRSVRWTFIFHQNKIFESAMECATHLAPDISLKEMPLYLAEGMVQTYGKATAIYTNLELVVVAATDSISRDLEISRTWPMDIQQGFAINALGVLAQPYLDEIAS
ncbi:hypothetical protein L2Y96_20515 [Luteibacter aegosomaticola]|uniref:hypothetical protein n=1 Tax=Luteibacter aegosomaticola TaxID=2911538 RepID=UPI001FFA0E51|nr:hypothetical protein [Luteibacter aegosomaticola]UPG89745.1 hypothetical protein L2Y96_20515 [Luteibacter aegosomaticola]